MQIQLMLAVLALLAIAAFGVYRWTQSRRVAGVNVWIRNFLLTRYGALPENLHIICTDEQLWPVLATFDRLSVGSRHMLHFSCSGDQSNYRLDSENEERRTAE